MLRRLPLKMSQDTSCQTPSPEPPLQHTRPLRYRMRKTNSSCWNFNHIFKVIVGIEATALLFIWVVFSDRLLSSRLWTQHLNVRRHPSKGEAIPFWGTTQHHHHQRGSAVSAVHDGSLRKVVLEIPDEYKGPTLVIGGSDGSGTRAVVDFVRRLGVPMRFDDKESFDVHGAVMFHGGGWPPLGNLILNATHSANYELDDLSNETRTTATKQLLKLKSQVDAFQSRFYNNLPNISRATEVSVGFKAPITMTVLPLLKDVFGPMKYLHVVRDGRDVSLSTNKSPVQKFFKSMYPDADERMANYLNSSEPVLAMHLWNDWNTQALDWERAHANEADFDFLVMRSEDLLDPAKKFESLVRMAEFVGSPMTTKELCCMSREKVVDMGRSLISSERAAGSYGHGLFRMPWDFRSDKFVHGDAREEVKARLKGRIQGAEKSNTNDRKRNTDLNIELLERRQENRRAFADMMHLPSTFRHRLDNSPKVEKRYGKWREMLKEKPDLSAKLHEAGAKGLATFGYEPQTSFYDSPSSINGFQCEETVICDEEKEEGITLRHLFHTYATKG